MHESIKSYGLMMVIGFMAAVTVIRRLSRSFTPDPQLITNAALYSLIGGVVGARVFYVVHYYAKDFRGEPWHKVFAIWEGGLELYGGVILAITIIFFYLLYHKLPMRRYLDVLAVGLLLALVFGRLGCFLNGCCWGRPTDSAWLSWMRFPYNSLAYDSQINADPDREREEPYFLLPRDEYFWSLDKEEEGKWYPKPFKELSEAQKYAVTKGQYRCLAVHPTQLYSSAIGGLSCFLVYFFWRRGSRFEQLGRKTRLLFKPGQTFALMFILYGVTRFFMEFLRDDNPFEYGPWTMRVIYVVYKGGTVSQNIGIYLASLGLVLMVVFGLMKCDKLAKKSIDE
ncbi:MAG: prolipoprotein diacylglyceryl transferase [Planctomycetota bacterium]